MYISGNKKALAEGNTVHKLLTRCQEKKAKKLFSLALHE